MCETNFFFKYSQNSGIKFLEKKPRFTIRFVRFLNDNTKR